MKVFVLTGAGVSAESGVATFRDSGGVWAKYDYRDVATPQGFARDPHLVHDFYNQRRRRLPQVAPNAAHYALARLQDGLEAKGGGLYLCTQNVDDLHERAGSRDVVHMHGQLARIRCAACAAARDWREDLSVDTACPACGAAGGLRPDVVWFGETPKFMDEIWAALEAADLFAAVGTSGSVYPAAGFVADARRWKIPTCEINLEPSDNGHVFDARRIGAATVQVPAWVNEVLAAA
jgi:NAD-dependent deacetylase